MITQKIDLNLIPGRVLPRVNVSQYDKGTRTLEFTIYNGDVSFDPTSYTAYIQGFKPDGHGFDYTATITDQKITADVTEQMTAVYGEVTCEVIIMDGTDRIGTGNFILNVERAAMPDDAQMSDSDYAYFEQLVEDAQQAVEDAQAEVENAEAWANGTRDGQTIPETDPAYQKNSKYWSEQSGTYAQESSGYSEDAEAWAVGERGGVPVDPSDPTYENSAHYWAQQASEALNDMTGATASTAGVHGLVPAPAAGDQAKYLKGDGTWAKPAASELSFDNNGTGMTATNPQDAITELNTDIKENAMTAVEKDDSLALAPTSAGNALPLTIYGQSTQNGTPTPTAPVAIESSSADFKCVGKNLISYPYQEGNVNRNGIDWIDNGDGTLTASGTATPNDSNHYMNLAVGYRKIYPAGTYKLTGGISNSQFLRLRNYNDPNNITTIASDYGNGVEFTLQEPTMMGIYASILKDTVVTTPITFKPMLRLASVADATYEPYKHTDITTNLTLRSIEVTSSDPYNLVKDGHYYIADTIDWGEVDGYTLTKRIEHLELLTTMTWGKAGTVNAFYITVNDFDKVLRYVKSNRFDGVIWTSGSFPAGDVVAFHNTNNLLYFRKDDTTNVDDWKTWLGSNPLYADYILATPTKTSITSAQAKALLSMRTYDESTSIDAVNSPAPVLELEYAKTRTPALALTGHNMAHINAIDIGDM